MLVVFTSLQDSRPIDKTARTPGPRQPLPQPRAESQAASQPCSSGQKTQIPAWPWDYAANSSVLLAALTYFSKKRLQIGGLQY